MRDTFLGTNRPPFTAPRQHVEGCKAAFTKDENDCDLCGRVDLPFSLPADSVEIVLDLPVPPSINRLWKYTSKPAKTKKTVTVRGRLYWKSARELEKAEAGRVYRSKEYVAWMEQADMTVMATKKPGRLAKISGPFEILILLNAEMSKADGDNICSKACLDYCQSRDIIRNDSDCRKGSWEWVEPERAPKGCRVVVRSLHEALR